MCGVVRVDLKSTPSGLAMLLLLLSPVEVKPSKPSPPPKRCSSRPAPPVLPDGPVPPHWDVEAKEGAARVYHLLLTVKAAMQIMKHDAQHVAGHPVAAGRQ